MDGRARALRRIQRTAAHLTGFVAHNPVANVLETDVDASLEDAAGSNTNAISASEKAGRALAATSGMVDVVAWLVYMRTGRRPSTAVIQTLLRSSAFLLWLKGPKPYEMVFSTLPYSRSSYAKALLGPVSKILPGPSSKRISCVVPSALFSHSKLNVYQSICAIKADAACVPPFFPLVAMEGMLLEIAAHPAFPLSLHRMDLLSCEVSVHADMDRNATHRFELILIEVSPERQEFVTHGRIFSAATGALEWENVSIYGERVKEESPAEAIDNAFNARIVRYLKPPTREGECVHRTTLTTHMGEEYQRLTALPDWKALVRPVAVRLKNRMAFKDSAAVHMAAGRVADSLYSKGLLPSAPYRLHVEFLSNLTLPTTLNTAAMEVVEEEEASIDTAQVKRFSTTARDPYSLVVTPCLSISVAPLS